MEAIRQEDGLNFEPERMRKTHWMLQNSTEYVFRAITIACAAMVLIVMGGLLFILLRSSWPALRTFGPGFLTSPAWDPLNQQFGALSSIYGTLVSTLIALVLAVPLSIVTATFLVEFAPPMLGRLAGYAIEMLAIVPGIIFGMWGLLVFAPFMAEVVQPALAAYLGFLPWFQGQQTGMGLLTAGTILALMIVPFMCGIMRDAFAMVPKIMKEASYGMGATAWEVTRDITWRQSLQGILGACLLGLGRALGEAVAIAFVIGNRAAMPVSLFEQGNSLPSRIINEFPETTTPLHMSALLALGLILFAISFVFQAGAQFWLKRLNRRRYRQNPAWYGEFSY